MKRILRCMLSCLLILVLLLSNAVTSYAHSGRTDSSGGHKDNKNKSGLGSYHYHCGGYPAHLHDGGYCPYTDVFPRGVSFSVENKNLRKGETTSFSAEVYPSDACNTRVTLSCEDTDVIRISGNTITAIGYGTAVITAESFNGKTTTVKIVVKEVTADKVSVTSSVEDDETVYIGDIVKCNATITPEDVDDPTIEWSSSDDSIATVDKNGTVKTLAEGAVTICATTVNGVCGEYAIDVKEKCVENVELAEDNMEILLYSEYSLAATVEPADATFPEIAWSSSNPEIVVVDENGKINAIGCGIATITATAVNGLFDDIEVEVTEIVAEQIKIIGENIFYIDDTSQLRAEIFPANTTVQDIEWVTSDSQIVSIDESGNINCLATGVATITAIQKDVVVSVEIEVKVKPVERIEIISSSKTPNKLKVGKTMTLSAMAYPTDATYTEITWDSSDTTIASIDNYGNIIANEAGTVVITARTQDGFVQEYEIKVVHTLGSFLKNLLGK